MPYPFEFELLDEDWDHFSILMDSAIHRLPVLEHTGIKKFYNGPESFTPDNQFILGEAPEVDGFFVGAGFNSVGIASAGGAGRALAEWIVNGSPTTDLSGVDIGASPPSTPTTSGCRTGSARSSACTTPSRGPTVSWRRPDPSGARPAYDLLVRAGPSSGRRWDGNGPMCSPLRVAIPP